MDGLRVRPSAAQHFETERWSVLDRSEVGRIE